MASPRYEDVRAAVLAGDYDSRILDLADALTARLGAENGPRTSWRVTIGDQDMTEEDITVGECIQIEKLTGGTWHLLKPGDSAEITQAFAVVCALRSGCTHEEALKRVSAMTVTDLVGAITRDQAAPPTDPAGRRAEEN